MDNKDFELELEQLLEEYGQESVVALKRQVKVQRLVATKDTLNSIRYKVQGKNKVVISFDSVLNIVDRGLGRGKSHPSSEEILKWMRAKNIRPRNNRKNNAVSSRFTNESDRNMESSAFAIARAIKRNGTIKRFGYGGAKVIKVIRKGSNAMKRLREGISEVTTKQVKLSFQQLKK